MSLDETDETLDIPPKVRAELVEKGLRAPERVPEICADAGVSETVFQEWSNTFLDGGMRALSQEAKAASGESVMDEVLCHKIVHSFPANLLVSRPDDGAILFRSRSTEATYGERGRTHDHWADPEERKIFIDQLKRTGRVESMFFRGQLYDGTEFPAQLSSRLIEHDGQTISVTTSTNLSKARAMSKEIERANLRLNEAIEAFGDGLVLWDSDFRLAMHNDRFLELFKIRGERPLTGASPAELQQVLLKTLKLPAHLSVSDALEGGLKAIRTYRKNLQLRTNDGRVIMLSTHQTKLDGYLCTFRDVTRRLQLQKEVEQQREVAHQNEKLSALGELLAGVAHELNNPLSVVTGYSLMLQERLSDPINKKRIDRIATAAERCARIVKTFLAMAREDPADLYPLSLNEVIETTLQDLEHILRSKGVAVHQELAASLPLVEADADQMVQVFTNLVSNAVQALENSEMDKVITLKTYYDDKDEGITAEVIDTGPGVPPELQRRIFEPFFTTKDAGEGTGIGLAFCHRIIDTFDGQISLEPAPSGGARFVVRLPKYEKTRPLFRPGGDDQDRIRKAVRVLIVDDEVSVRDLLEDLLNEAVFRVEAVRDAQSALDLLATTPFDIVLSDVRMPGIDGIKFYTKLIKSDPEYTDRFAFITGDLLNSEVARFIKQSGVPHIEKPVIPAELSTLVNHLCAKMEGAQT